MSPNKRLEKSKGAIIILLLALFLSINILALFIYFAEKNKETQPSQSLKVLDDEAPLESMSAVKSGNTPLLEASYLTYGSGGSSSSSSNNNHNNNNNGVGSSDDECKDFGFDFGVSRWKCECSKSFSQISINCVCHDTWTLEEEIYPGTSVTGTCKIAFWDTGSSNADGIVVKAGDINHGGYYYSQEGISGTENLPKDISHITFCGHYGAPDCGNNITDSGEECDLGNNNGKQCVPEYNKTCIYCSNTCKNKTLTRFCGDNILDSEEECDDGNNMNKDGCSANCTIEKECCDDKDCPPDSYSNKYCYNTDVYRNLTDYFCKDGNCLFNISKSFVQDCGNESYSDNYCKNNDVYQNHSTPGCENGGCILSTEINKTQECGNDSYEEIKYCYSGDVWINKSEELRGCELGQCFDSSEFTSELFEDCDNESYSDNYCYDNDVYVNHTLGSCANKACILNTNSEKTDDCGENSCDNWSDYVCEGKNKTRTKTCYDKGCEVGACFNNTRQEKETQECEYDCVNGECTQPRCGDGIINGNEQCEPPNTATCDANCMNIRCNNNSECGIDGWLNQDYCVCTTNVWDFWKIYECNNPGTANSYCTNRTEIRLKQECGEDSCTDYQNYCEDNDVWKKRTCQDVGCDLGACFNNTILNTTLVQDCGENLYRDWNNYCIGKEVWRNKTDILKGCNSEEGCYEDNDYKNEFVETCIYDCVDGSCTECEHDVGIRYSYGNSFGTGIAIGLANGTWLHDPVELIQGENYTIRYIIDNKIENTTNNIHVIVKIDEIILADYNYSINKEHSKSINLSTSSLVGEHNISVYVEKINEIDCNMSDNYAEREITIKPECCDDEDCPNDTYSDNYCLNNNVWKNLTDYFCKNGECLFNISKSFVQDCGNESYSDEYCYDNDVYVNHTLGSCANKACILNTNSEKANDCGENSCDNWTDYVCEGKNRTRTKTCYDKGCSLGSCFNNSRQEKETQECEYDCVNGSCTQPICGNNITEQGEECDDGNLINGDGCDEFCKIEECCNDSQCPNDTSDYYCYYNDVYENLTDHFCKDGKCLFNINSMFFQDCGGDSYEEELYCYNNDLWKNITEELNGCLNGACTSSIEFTSEFFEDCGEDEYEETYYCKNNDVWYKNESIERGCSNAECFENEEGTDEKHEDCMENSYGDWNYYCIGKEIWKNKTDILRGCSNAECFENKDYENKYVDYCEQECVNGECRGECEIDTDCGNDSYGESYCGGNSCPESVYKDFHDFSCSSRKKCVETITPELIDECDFTCLDNRCVNQNCDGVDLSNCEEWVDCVCVAYKE